MNRNIGSLVHSADKISSMAQNIDIDLRIKAGGDTVPTIGIDNLNVIYTVF